MFGAGESKDAGTPLGMLHSSMSLGERFNQWQQLVEQNAPLEQIQEAEYLLSEAAKKHPFELKQNLPKFLEVVKKLDARIPFQSFRLPGKDRVVVDRREADHGKPEEAAKDAVKKEVAKEAREASQKNAREMVLKKGKLVAKKGGAYANHLGDRAGAGGLDRAAAASRVERLLSAFERMVIARFEEGEQVARYSEDGKPHFLQKTKEQWRAFFKSFLSRTVKKKALLSDIRNFLFRGAVAKGAKGVFIGDINMSDGRVEKFVRFSILAEALAKLGKFLPGQQVGKDVLGKLSSEELMYLALAAARARAFTTAKKPQQGRFMGGRAEAQAAEALGLPIEGQLKEKARRLRRGKGGMFGGDLLGEEGPPDETPYRFVPWWHWGNLTRPGKFRWTTVVFYGSLLAVALLGVAVLTYRLLGGG